MLGLPVGHPAAAILPNSISEQDAPEDDARVGWAGIGQAGKTLGDRIGKRTANGVVNTATAWKERG